MSSFYEDDQATLSNDSFGSRSLDLKTILCLSFGCLCIALGIIDMIVFYVVPTKKANDNKKKYPDATFSTPNKTIIALHFVLHSFLILFGIMLIVYGFIDNLGMTIAMAITGFAVCVIWIVDLGICSKKSFNPKSQITAEKMQSMMSVSRPVEFYFIYTEDENTKQDCHWDSHDGTQKCTQKTVTCYSRHGITIPIITSVTSFPFNFTDIPDLLFFTLQYDVQMTSDMKNKYNSILDAIKKCDKSHPHKVYEMHPQTNGTYIISKTKVPSALKKSARLASFIFGAGAYYEIYSKSFPSITYKMTMIGEPDPKTNYNDIFNNCADLGTCSENNKKPKP